MAKEKVSINNNNITVEGEPVVFPPMPLERMSTLSEIYPELFPDVQKKRKRNIPLKPIATIIAFLAVASFLIYYFNLYVTLMSVVDSQKAQIDAELQRRANLVPNLVKTMETYTVYENRLVSYLAEVRSALVYNGKYSSQPIRSLEEAISRLLAIVERYPDLKASATFQTLMTQLAETENRIAERRAAYNRSAMAYNNQLNSIPGCFLRYPFRLKFVKYFQAEEEGKKLPTVKLDLSQLQK